MPNSNSITEREVVERVARALREVEWGEAGSWEDACDEDHEYWRKSARAAISAIGNSAHTVSAKEGRKP